MNYVILNNLHIYIVFSIVKALMASRGGKVVAHDTFPVTPPPFQCGWSPAYVRVVHEHPTTVNETAQLT